MITIEAQMNAIRNLTDQSRRCIFMKRSVILWLAVSAVIMFALPWLAVTFVKGDAGMAVCFMLFYAVNPIYSIVIGAFAGREIKHLFSLPLISSIMYLLGVWMFFDLGESVYNVCGDLSYFRHTCDAGFHVYCKNEAEIIGGRF